MKSIKISALKEHIGQTITLQGWVHTIRDQKHIQFIILRDNTGLAQIAHSKTQNPVLTEQITHLTRESVITLTGQVVENPSVRLGGLEIHIETLTIENTAHTPLPIDHLAENEPSLEHRLNWRHLDLRSPLNRLMFEIQTTAIWAMRNYWQQEGFIEIHSPKLMGTASESGAELFELSYFNTTAYLAQSPQFYKQMAMASGFDRVFEIAPVFRADPSFTSRHTTEFTSVDVEMAWIKSHDDVMHFEACWLQHILQTVHNKHQEAIWETFGIELQIPQLPFPTLTMSEAIHILAKQGHTPEREGDLDPQGERLISEYIFEKHGHEFVFITDYPISVRPFYHMRHTETPNITKSFDLLWKGLEITTGAQREHRLEILKEQAIEKGLSLESIDFYLNFFKYGCPPHGGFGFGLSRMLMVMLNMPNVRETTFLPRTPNRLHP